VSAVVLKPKSGRRKPSPVDVGRSGSHNLLRPVSTVATIREEKKPGPPEIETLARRVLT
jgi:hypothetical protein